MKTNDLIKLSKSELRGKIVAFPTDTVNGVGAMIDDDHAIDKIYQLKQRDAGKPLAVLAPSVESVLPYIEYPTLEVLELMNKYWPGALTIIFNKNENCCLNAFKDLNTIAFRIPNSPIALEILRHFGPMATSSVNLSGNQPLNSYQEIKLHFDKLIDYIIEEDETKSGVSSTIIDATKKPYVVLRQGDIKIK